MNPSRVPGVEDPEKVERELLCVNYDSCLDLALSKSWKGFSCNDCKCFSPMQKCWEDWEEDMYRCGALIGVVYGFRGMSETGFWGASKDGQNQARRPSG